MFYGQTYVSKSTNQLVANRMSDDEVTVTGTLMSWEWLCKQEEKVLGSYTGTITYLKKCNS